LARNSKLSRHVGFDINQEDQDTLYEPRKISLQKVEFGGSLLEDVGIVLIDDDVIRLIASGTTSLHSVITKACKMRIKSLKKF